MTKLRAIFSMILLAGLAVNTVAWADRPEEKMAATKIPVGTIPLEKLEEH